MTSICENWLLLEWDNILEKFIIIYLLYLGRYGWDDTNSKREFAKYTLQKYYFIREFELNKMNKELNPE